MYPRVPNKLASIFITGGLAAVLVLIFYGSDLTQNLIDETASVGMTESNGGEGGLTESNKGGSRAFFASAWSLALFTGAITLFGAIIQGFGHMIRTALQRFLTFRIFCHLLWQESAWDEIRAWNCRYKSLARATSDWAEGTAKPNKFTVLYKIEKSSGLSSFSSRIAAPVVFVFVLIVGLMFDSMPKALPLALIVAAVVKVVVTYLEARKQEGSIRLQESYAATVHPIIPQEAISFFFRYADGQHLAWILQHYSTYYLTTDLFAAIIATGFTIPVLSGEQLFWPLLLVELEVFETQFWDQFFWYTMLALSSFLLLIVSAHRYLYTYIAAVRHCCAILSYPNPYSPSVPGPYDVTIRKGKDDILRDSDESRYEESVFYHLGEFCRVVKGIVDFSRRGRHKE